MKRRLKRVTHGGGKVIVINKSVVSDIANAKSDVVHSLNAKGNETIYLENIPEYVGNTNSKNAVGITKEDFDKGKGYKVAIKYEVSLQVKNNSDFNKFKEVNRFNAKYSFLADDGSQEFSRDNAAFFASTSVPFIITPNQEFFNNYSLTNTTPFNGRVNYA